MLLGIEERNSRGSRDKYSAGYVIENSASVILNSGIYYIHHPSIQQQRKTAHSSKKKIFLE
jgi:hypothetical protein